MSDLTVHLEGLPAGWKPVRFGVPRQGDAFFSGVSVRYCHSGPAEGDPPRLIVVADSDSEPGQPSLPEIVPPSCFSHGYVAMDSNRKWYWYSQRPQCREYMGVWDMVDGTMVTLNGAVFPSVDASLWNQTVTQCLPEEGVVTDGPAETEEEEKPPLPAIVPPSCFCEGWIAMDGDGTWYWYLRQPDAKETIWDARGADASMGLDETVFHLPEINTCRWRETLTPCKRRSVSEE